MEQKVLSNTDLMQARNDILNAINSTLEKGIPVSVVRIILENCLSTVDMVLNNTLAQEAKSKEEIKEE